jgi:hypothetical protein
LWSLTATGTEKKEEKEEKEKKRKERKIVVSLSFHYEARVLLVYNYLHPTR